MTSYQQHDFRSYKPTNYNHIDDGKERSGHSSQYEDVQFNFRIANENGPAMILKYQVNGQPPCYYTIHFLQGENNLLEGNLDSKPKVLQMLAKKASHIVKTIRTANNGHFDHASVSKDGVETSGPEWKLHKDEKCGFSNKNISYNEKVSNIYEKVEGSLSELKPPSRAQSPESSPRMDQAHPSGHTNAPHTQPTAERQPPPAKMRISSQLDDTIEGIDSHVGQFRHRLRDLESSQADSEDEERIRTLKESLRRIEENIASLQEYRKKGGPLGDLPTSPSEGSSTESEVIRSQEKLIADLSARLAEAMAGKSGRRNVAEDDLSPRSPTSIVPPVSTEIPIDEGADDARIRQRKLDELNAKIRRSEEASPTAGGETVEELRQELEDFGREISENEAHIDPSQFAEIK
ncbi:MAG: putative nucleic acid-binding Zn-ribbon protein, partial [Chlamydiales bacterium]